MEPTTPLHHRVRRRITRTRQVCGAWCRQRRVYDRVLPLSFLFGVLFFLLYYATLAAPFNFPPASLVNIPQGETVKEAAQMLKAKGYIRSTLIFDAAARYFGTGAGVIAGEYFFPAPESVLTVAARLTAGDHELKPVRVTVPEGASSRQIAALLAQKLPDFNAQAFLALARPHEGMLYPDTYFFFPGEDPSLVLSSFLHNFQAHIDQQNTAAAITSFGKPLSAVLTMASLLEKEAPDAADRKIISGILWHRLSLGMPLQVDAVFPYIIGKYSLELTRADLATSSPYNTYTHKGLPPGPIANPSTNAIMAAVEPTKTDYLYYLSDKSGTIHYCATYACQKANARKYLGG